MRIRTTVLALGVFALGSVLTLAASVATAQNQDSVAVNSGSVFGWGNDLGAPPFKFWIANDSLRFLGSEQNYAPGYTVGMRKSPEWDAVDRKPTKPDSLDAAAEVHAALLRQQDAMTQGDLLEAMVQFYRVSPTVFSVTIEEGYNIAVQYRRFNLPIRYPFPLRVVTHQLPSADVKLAGLRQKLRDYADCLEGGGMIYIGDGSNDLQLNGAKGAELAENIRTALRQGSSAIRTFQRERRLPDWLAEELANPRPLPGYR